MGHRNPDIGRRRNAGGDPGTTSTGTPRLAKISGFFTTTAKKERITTFSAAPHTATPSQLLQ